MGILEKIQELCKEKGINPSKLETELGFGKGTLYKWNKSIPKSDKLEKVANYFRVSVDYLLDRGDIYDIGHAIKEEREAQGLSLKELSEAMGITEEELGDYEDNIVPLKDFELETICVIFGMSVEDFLMKYDLYDGYTPSHFNGDLRAYLSFQKAVDEDVLNESKTLDLTNTVFTTAQEAMEFILKQPALMAFGGYDLNKMSDDEIIDFANELLRQFELISYKYKK